MKVSQVAAWPLELTHARSLAPGLILTAAIGAGAVGMEWAERRALGQPIIEALVAAIVLGMLLRNAVDLPAEIEAGAGFAAKQILEVGVLLLGATIDARQVLAAGPILLLAILIAVSGGILCSYLLGRTLGLHRKLALLIAVGNSICGNSAIAAVAPVIRADKRDVASSIALTAMIGVLVVLGLPLLLGIARLTLYQYGVLAGMTVYAVPQVVAASFAVSQLSGEVATLVKLVRVLCLGPVVLVLSLASRRSGTRRGTENRPALVPWFIAGFIVLAALRSLGMIPGQEADPAREASRILTILAMAGLGLGVDVRALRTVGPRVGIAVIGSLIFLIALSLTLIQQFRITG